MRRLTALSVVALALGLAGCGLHTTKQISGVPPSAVPNVVGMKLRAAEQELYRNHLRWRIAPGRQVHSRPYPPGTGSSMDDISVVAQHPAAGQEAKRGAVVTLITPCTRAHPCS